MNSPFQVGQTVTALLRTESGYDRRDVEFRGVIKVQEFPVRYYAVVIYRPETDRPCQLELEPGNVFRPVTIRIGRSGKKAHRARLDALGRVSCCCHCGGTASGHAHNNCRVVADGWDAANCKT